MVHGDLVNRMVWEVDGELSGRLAEQGVSAPEGSLLIEEYPGGLELQDCLLVVEGDLDLGADAGIEAPSLHGTNATLIGTGTLILSGGQLDSRDQGMVIYARDLVFKGGGDFRGLIVAASSATIVPDGERHLEIRGGLICGAGAAVLRSVDLRWDPRYLRALHGAGHFRLTSWERL